MARPFKENAEWFKHSSNLRNTPEVLALRRRFKGDICLAFYFLLETLAGSSNFEIEMTDTRKVLLSAEFGISEEDFSELIVYCIQIKLLEYKEEEIIHCPFLTNSLDSLKKKRKYDRDRLLAEKTYESKNSDSTEVKQNSIEETSSGTDNIIESADGKNFTNADGIAYLLDDKKWLEAASGSLGISIFETKEWLKDLSKEWELKGQTIHKDLADIKSHFINQMEKKKQKGVSLKISTVKKWQFCMDSLSKNLSLEEKKVIETIKLEEVDNTNTKISLSSANQQQAKELIKKYLDNINELTRIAFGKVFKFFIAT